MSGDVLVVGDLMVDVVVVASGPLVHGSDTPAEIRSIGGGAAANTACWLAELGRPVRLVAAIGDDAIGHGAVDQLEAGGVRFAGSVDPVRASGSCVVLVDPDGDRTMLPDRGANDALSVATVEAAMADRPDWLHLSGYTLLDDGSRPAAVAAITAARSAGVPMSMDASSHALLLQVGGALFLDWVAGAQVLFANDDELAALDGAAAVLRRAAVLVAKHGPAGSSWITAEGSVSIPAVPVAVVDTVGAGDALDAGVIDALLRGSDPQAALAAGAAVAARSVAQAGARP